MIARLLLQNTIFVVAMGALLFAVAGTLHWPGAWVLLITSAALGPLCGWWLYRLDPALLAERLGPLFQKDQPVADKVFMAVFVLVILIWLVAMGLDRRYLASDMSLALQVLGFLLSLLSTAVTLWVFRENSFAAPVVKLQSERAQHVVSIGPYAYVRHPMYSGMMLFFIGVPLLVGSWWGVAMVPLFLLLFAIRIRIEERTLREGLPGYADYAARVRHRLLPGIW
jgi:protein-S-isoprenylcysteine O-methyltransferase Ste14